MIDESSICIIQNQRAAEDASLQEAIVSLNDSDSTIVTKTISKECEGIVLTEQALAEGCATIVAAGGDGTVNEVLNVVMDSDATIGILPYGTGNDFARAANIPLDDPRKGLELILRAKPTLVDVAQVNGRRFLNVTTGGQAAEVTTSTPETMKTILGGFAYMLTGLAHSLALSPRFIRLTGPDFAWEGETLAFAVGNARQAGGGYRMTPQAYIDDGLLDVIVVPDVPWTEFLAVVQDFFSEESPRQSEYCEYRQLEWLELEAPEEFQLNLDGEPLRDTHFRFELCEKRVPCLLPAECPLLLGDS